jgi:radical SAM protein with 4Fe4S-binding SPASM domain
MEALDAARPLFPDPDNYLYEVPGSCGHALLFNPAIHYWTALNETAGRVITALEPGITLPEAAERLGLAQVVLQPFVARLFDLRFYSHDRRQPAASWVPNNFDPGTPEQYPFEDIIISLGDRCNLACPYCFNAGDRKHRLDQGNAIRRLTSAEIARLLAEFKDMGGQGVIFTGGEPTLNPELVDICAGARRLGLAVKVITNGTRLDGLPAQQLVDSVDVLAVSLDSLDDAVNAELWGTARYRIVTMMATLGRIGRLRRPDGTAMRIAIKPTITAKNVERLPKLIINCLDSLDGCDLAFDISAFEPTGNLPVDSELRVRRDRLDSALSDAAAQLMARSTTHQPTQRAAYAELFALTDGGKTETPRRPAVLSCVPSLFVTNGGDIYPCQALELPEFHLGSAYGGTLREAFARSRFAQLRREMSRDHIEVCRSCEFRFVCTEHCHGAAFKQSGRTTAFLKFENTTCRERVIRRLWLEAQLPEGTSA